MTWSVNINYSNILLNECCSWAWRNQRKTEWAVHWYFVLYTACLWLSSMRLFYWSINITSGDGPTSSDIKQNLVICDSSLFLDFFFTGNEKRQERQNYPVCQAHDGCCCSDTGMSVELLSPLSSTNLQQSLRENFAPSGFSGKQGPWVLAYCCSIWRWWFKKCKW